MEIIYDEARVPIYTLPDPLVFAAGHPVRDAAMWHAQRRPELLALFADTVYGRTPADAIPVHIEQRLRDAAALGGAATRVELRLHVGAGAAPFLDLLLYLPNGRSQPAPLFVGLNFNGNHAIHPDSTITISSQWMPETPTNGAVAHRATAASRGTEASRGQSRRSSRAAMVWPRPTTATSTPTSTTASTTACTRCSAIVRAPARPGARSGPGPGASAV
jgi:hypothetical protein